MCIVSLFFEEGGEFILTHNRDESIFRPFSKSTETNERFGQPYTAPLDLVSGGTWIYYSPQFAACILNGAYKPHMHTPPYRLSRGLLILELLKYTGLGEFISEVDLNGIEPFTMIMIDKLNQDARILVWDETLKHTEDLSGHEIVVRASSPLYTAKEKEELVEIFKTMKHPEPDELFELHDRLKMTDNKDVPIVKTTSITQIVHRNGESHMKFCPITYPEMP